VFDAAMVSFSSPKRILLSCIYHLNWLTIRITFYFILDYYRLVIWTKNLR
jgi:hypothetical protein